MPDAVPPTPDFRTPSFESELAEHLRRRLRLVAGALAVVVLTMWVAPVLLRWLVFGSPLAEARLGWQVDLFNLGGAAFLFWTWIDLGRGKHGYSAPEMFFSEEAGPASDLYSLAAVAYFALTATHPFPSATVLEVIEHHRSTIPEPPSARNAAVPADLEEVVLAALEKDPADRPGSADAMRAAIGSCRDAGAWTPEDAERWWRSFLGSQ